MYAPGIALSTSSATVVGEGMTASGQRSGEMAEAAEQDG